MDQSQSLKIPHIQSYSSWKKCNNMVLSWLKVEIRIMVPNLAAANNVSTAIEVQHRQLLALLNSLADFRAFSF